MSANIIISYDGTDTDRDALALGRLLSESGAQVSLAYVRHTHEADEQHERDAQHAAEQVLESGAQSLGQPNADRHVVMSGSTGQGLWALAVRERADLIVFGSDAHTALGHVQPGRSALRLIEGGPVAIAIAPAGLRDRSEAGLRRIALAGGDIDPAARETATELAAIHGAEVAGPAESGVDLIVVGSRPGTPYGQVGVSAASEYLIETANAAIMIVRRGVAVHAGATAPTTPLSA
jgi:nucleotide-binding universal stress UspA family protein